MHRSRARQLTLFAALVIVLAACGGDDEAADGTAATPAPGGGATPSAAATNGADDAPVEAVSLPFTANGTNEVPEPGDGDAIAVGTITVDPGTGEVCVTYDQVFGLPAAGAAHIHSGPAGEAGDVVVEVAPPNLETLPSSSCHDADAELAGQIADSPRDFYLNVHNEEFPDGAIRAQLSTS